MADVPIDALGVDPVVDEAKDDPTRFEYVGPKDPEHGERPIEYFQRVDAATTIKGPAHLEPGTTHYWGGNSEFRSTGVVPVMPTVHGILPIVDTTEHVRVAEMQRANSGQEPGFKSGSALVPIGDASRPDIAERRSGFAAVAPPLPERHDEPTEKNTRPE